jgi:hypothetical protein
VPLGIEACLVRHWSRELQAVAHTVRLIPPAYVRPYVKRKKNDAADAEAICEVTRAYTRFGKHRAEGVFIVALNARNLIGVRVEPSARTLVWLAQGQAYGAKRIGRAPAGANFRRHGRASRGRRASPRTEAINDDRLKRHERTAVKHPNSPHSTDHGAISAVNSDFL